MKRITKILSICLGILFLFVVGCNKKTEATTNKKTNKTTNQTTTTKTTSKESSTKKFTTTKTTSKESSTKKSTTKKTTKKKTTTTANTTLENNKHTLIDLFDSYSNMSVSFTYSEEDSIITKTEDTYIEDGTPIDITISFIGDYLVTITDGEFVTTEYLFYDGQYIFIGEHDDPEPQTFTINDYTPKNNLVEITYRSLYDYEIIYDESVDNVDLTINGTKCTNSTTYYVKEMQKINAKVENKSSGRILFETYKYDSNDEPTILVNSQIINKNETYTLEEFNMETSKLYYKVTEYVAYSITFKDMAMDTNLTYDLISILDGKEIIVESGKEYIGGSKLKVMVTNKSSKDIALKVTDSNNHKIKVIIIEKNTTYTMPDEELITIDKNLEIYSEFADYLDVTLKQKVDGVTYTIQDKDNICYNFGPVRSGYLTIIIHNGTENEVWTAAYDDDNNGINSSVTEPGSDSYIVIHHFDENVNLFSESCPGGKKFYIDAGYNADMFKLYDTSNNELSLDDGLSIGKSVILMAKSYVMTDMIFKVYDFTNDLQAVGYIYANGQEGISYMSFTVYSDMKVLVEQKSDSVVLEMDVSYDMSNVKYTMTDESGDPIDFSGRFIIAEKDSTINLTLQNSNNNNKFKAYAYYYEGETQVYLFNDTVNKGETKTFTFKIPTDIKVRYMFL